MCFLKHAQQASSQKKPLIIALWHSCIFLVYPILKRHLQFQYSAFISKSRDGEIPAGFATVYPQFKTIRVGHQAKPQATLNMIEELKQGRILIITPDGPRGPKEKVKPGVIYAACKVGATILPFSWTATRYWTLNSWDQFMIPKPFSTIEVTFNEPLSPELGKDVLFKELLEKALSKPKSS